jgi:hypothetical protein
MMAHLQLARLGALIPPIQGSHTTMPTLAPLPIPTTASAPAPIPPVVAPAQPKRKRLMISNGVSEGAAKRLADEAEKLLGELSHSGSGGNGWRSVNWSLVHVRRGDCAGVARGGFRRSLRIPILEERRKVKQAMGQARITKH